ncbi:MAG: GNAT family N-acetyltransferase [Rhodoferax sp.]|nr:MAG: GNAT family N-acetyltransferase [Rhodoferax sp.]
MNLHAPHPPVSAADVAMLEAAAFQSWPALEPEEDVQGWRLRFARGYTKRANSANSTAQACALDADLLQALEQRFAQRGLTPVFRLVEGTVPAGAEALLEARGYRAVDPSLVLVRELEASDAAIPPPQQLPSAADWLQTFVAVSGKPLQGQDTHLQMLQSITAPCCWAYSQQAGQSASTACALGVLAQGQLGLFDIATRADLRRQGLAAALVQRVLGWGARQGAQRAYLQVLGSNAPALALYQKLGFRLAYRYAYRVAT